MQKMYLNLERQMPTPERQVLAERQGLMDDLRKSMASNNLLSDMSKTMRDQMKEIRSDSRTVIDLLTA
ncbi:MAG: hypothetical protein JWR21_920 [Herminiimonas sp.]|nr:hypothetical protein [Herminiimonas sp.]